MATEPLKVAVLGCGPTGLLAAHGVLVGAMQTGKEVELQIFSTKRKSPLYGCQYLHSLIPGLVTRFERVSYRLTGSITGYRNKVYGNEAAEDIAVSPELLESDHTAWDIRQAYDQLWEMYEPLVQDYFFNPGSFQMLEATLKAEGTDLIISSLPAPALCRGTHRRVDGEMALCTFSSQMVWAMGDAPALDRWAAQDCPPATIVCNGDPTVDWYRASHVFGHRTVEWPEEAAPPRGASRVSKPLRTNCVCNPEVMRVGRYGKWEKGVLSHEAYFEAYGVVAKW